MKRTLGKYKLTPLNICAFIVFALSLYGIIDGGTWGFGFLVGLYLLILSFFLFFVDYSLQELFAKYKWVLFIELAGIIVVLFFYMYSQRTKTLIIADSFDKGYIAIIYGVPDRKSLPSGWSYSIDIPKDGLVYTSSVIKDELPQTIIKTKSGKVLNTEDIRLEWGDISGQEIVCKNQKYDCSIWLIDSFCCTYSSEDIEEINTEIQSGFCNLNPRN